MKTRAQALLLTIAMAFLPGCYTATSATHSTVANDEWLVVTKTQHGYSMGPCGFAKGGTWTDAEIHLNGRKGKYADGEFSVDFPYDPMASVKTGHGLEFSGTISVDWAKRKLVINLTEWPAGHPEWGCSCRINGKYSFREEKANERGEVDAGTVLCLHMLACWPDATHRDC